MELNFHTKEEFVEKKSFWLSEFYHLFNYNLFILCKLITVENVTIWFCYARFPIARE